MKECPVCKKEYDNEGDVCPNCSVEGREQQAAGEVNWVVLTTVGNDIEYEMTAGVLQMGNIPAVRRLNGIDGFVQVIVGFPIAGIDVMVPEDKYEEALQLLNAQIEEEPPEEE